MISEIFIQLRWRLTVACPRCGFDPVLYVKDPEKAARRVRQFYDETMKQQKNGKHLEKHKKMKIQTKTNTMKKNKLCDINKQ